MKNKLPITKLKNTPFYIERVNQVYSKLGKLYFERSPFADGVKLRLPYIDYDYIDKLSDSERKWLRKFSREYYQGNKLKDNSIHDTKYNKELYNRNNSQNRCIFAQSRVVHKKLVYINSELDRLTLIEQKMLG